MSTNGYLCDFSNYGNKVDIAAPGRDIYSTLPKDKYGDMSGTSMAAPFVSGIVALLKSNNPTLSAKMIRQKILAGHSVLTKGGQQPKISVNAYGALSVSLETPQPNIERYGASAAETAKGTFLIGGYDGAGQYISQIEKYDETKNAWVNSVSASTLARAFQSSVVINGKAYLLGGYGGMGISDAVYCFDGNEGQLIGTMPAAAYAMAVASDNTYIYTIGGVNDTGYLNDVRRYNVAADTWQTLPDLPVNCGYGKAACWNGSVYVFGGANETGCLSGVYRLDTVANQWEACASMNIARSNMGFCQINDKMYVLGGQVSYTEDGTDGIINQSNGWTVLQTTSVEEYDSVLDAWTERIDLPQAKAGFAIAEVNETLMLYGGFDDTVPAEGFAYYGAAVPQLNLSTDGDTVIVSWNKIAGVSGYQLEVNGQVTEVGAEASYSHVVQEGTVYQYRVRAMFANGEGAWSSSVYKTPYDSRRDAKQIISGTAVNDKLYYLEQEIWYRFTPETAGTLDIVLGDIPQNCLYRVSLYNETGEIIINDIDQNGNKVVENLSVLPYNYYIKVFSDLGVSVSQAFSLMVNFTASAEGEIPLRMQMSTLQQNITTVTPDLITDAPMNSISYVPPVSFTTPDIWLNAEQVSNGSYKECTVTETAPATFQIYIPSGKKLVVVTRPKDGKTIGVPNVYDTTTDSFLSSGYIRHWENDSKVASTHYVSHYANNYGVMVSAKPGELSNGKSAVFEVDFYIVDTYDGYEPNQNFDDGTADSPLGAAVLGDGSRYTSGISGLNFDTAVDEDYYYLGANEGDKITVCLETFGEMKADSCALYLFSNMRTEENGTWTDYWYTINKYENPSPPQASDKMKYVTYVAPASGDYYIYLRNKEGNTEGEYKLTVTKTSLNGDLTGEQYSESLTNDFISYNGTDITAELNSSVSGKLDNQLDIDWYRIPVGNRTQTKTITLEGADALKQNSVFVLYDLSEQQFIMQSTGASSLTYTMEPGKKYYVGITPKATSEAWNSIKVNSEYKISINYSSLFLSYHRQENIGDGDYTKPVIGTNNQFTCDVPIGADRAILYARWSGDSTAYLKSEAYVAGEKIVSFYNVRFDSSRSGKKIELYVDFLKNGNSVARSSSLETIVQSIITPQEVVFDQNPSGENHKYIYVDEPEHIPNTEIVNQENSMALMHLDHLQPGTYTLFEYHHKGMEGYVPQGTAFSGNDSLYYNGVFYNTGNDTGTIKVTKLGVTNAGYDGNWNLFKTWGDFSGNEVNSPGQRMINDYKEIGAPKEIFQDQNGDHFWWFSDMLVSGDILISDNEGYGYVWIMMEFVVLEGSVSLATMASSDSNSYGNQNFTSYFVPGETKSQFADQNPVVMKGIGNFAQTIEAAPMHFYIDNDTPSGENLKFIVKNEKLYPGQNNITESFYTHSMPLFEDCKKRMPESAILPLTYDGPLITDDGGLSAPVIFDGYHSAYMNYCDVPFEGRIGPYKNKAQFSGNEEFDVDWMRALPADDPTRTNAAANGTESLSDFIGHTTMQGYGVTHKYTVTIHNAADVDRRFIYHPTLQMDYYIKYWINNGEIKKKELYQEDISQKEWDEKVIDVILPSGEETTIEFEVTQYTGSSATCKNRFIIE